MKLPHDEVVLRIAKCAMRLRIDIQKVSGIAIFAFVEAIKKQDFETNGEANFCIRQFMKKEFKKEAA